MRIMLAVAVAVLALVSACDFFDTTAVKNKADNERKLKELQWALLIPQASPPAVPTPETATGNNSASADTEAAATDPVAQPAEHEAPVNEHAATETAPPEDEHPVPTPPGAAHAAETENGHSGESGETVDHDPAKAVPTTLAVVAVVDSFTLLPVDEEADPAERAKALDLAQRRERVVRQELQNVLVANTMITVVQPNQQQISQARTEIGATNSAAISNSMLPGLAETLGVQHVVTAFVDLEGHEVNIVAQHAPDGTIVFQDTLMAWEPVMAVAKDASAGAEEEAL